MATGQIIGIVLTALFALWLLSSVWRRGAARDALVWLVLFVGLATGIGVWDEYSRTQALTPQVLQDGRIEVIKAADGHFHLILNINGAPVDFLVDTGASQIVLTRGDAARVGLDLANLNFSGTALTANGPVRTAPVTLNRVQLEGITDNTVAASVNAGAMDGSLLGMSYLSRFESVEFRGDRLILTR